MSDRHVTEVFTHTTQKTYVPPAKFESAIPKIKGPHYYALGRKGTEIGPLLFSNIQNMAPNIVQKI
jgi:hypothetical protein